MKKQARDATARFEEAIAHPKKKNYVLRLYVAGTTPRSARSIANVREICEQHLAGHYRLEVIDLYQQPQMAEAEQIVAAPTLIKELPAPVRRVLGDMSRTERVLFVLGIKPPLEGTIPGAT
jgi:circadian clock protein KaiB